MQSLVWLMLKTERGEIIGAKNLFTAFTFFSLNFPLLGRIDHYYFLKIDFLIFFVSKV